MRWIEAAISTTSEEIDALCEKLGEYGIQGFSIEDELDFQNFLEQNRQFWDYVDSDLENRFRGISRIKFYLTDDESGRKALHEIQEKLHREISDRVIDDADWENSWKTWYQPIPIGDKLMVLTDWMEDTSDGRAVLRQTPGLAFGTGSHATTRMCLEVLDSLELEGKRVLDLGCGSGILGIASLILGCKTVLGCDIDPNARTAAEGNAALNHLTKDRFSLRIGNVLTDEGLRESLGAGYDLVLANIVADVVIPISGFVRRFLKPEGCFLCSGIIDGRAEEVEAALRSNGMTILRHLHEEEWNCYYARV